mmetsp:Transcript_1620/g.1560  ORF Transcript_1620/g.1560 Transcript_1620/m.1560 type:complete len:127 (-) Transcript_1620:18-398(-)
MQKFMGPRFFIPEQVRTVEFFSFERHYSYHVKFDSDSQVSDSSQGDNEGQNPIEECVICMQDLKYDLCEDGDLNTSKDRLAEYMRTPCNHKFHDFCLRDWMKVKMECPTCRREIPPIIDEENDDEY